MYATATAAIAASTGISPRAGTRCVGHCWPRSTTVPSGHVTVSTIFTTVKGIVAGALWALLPAVLRTRFKVDDVVTTLLLNFILLYIMGALLDGPIRVLVEVAQGTKAAVQDRLRRDGYRLFNPHTWSWQPDEGYAGWHVYATKRDEPALPE